MSNGIYDAGSTLFLSGFDWVAQAVDAYLIDSAAYTVSLTGHSSLSSVPVGARIAGPIALSGKAIVAGAADCNDIVFPSVVGATSEALLIVKHTGADATDTLLVYIDTATGLPITPNGGDLRFVVDNGTYRLFKP